MSDKVSRLLFDRRDHELLRIINDVCCGERALDYTRRLYYAHFHPRGIKELAESRRIRIAYAVVYLLTSLEVGRVDERLGALRALRSEVIDAAVGAMPKNTARVLLQIMKELVRAHGDYRRQLELAHDFRITASGNPLIVRRQLRRYHLLEMPAEWNQIAFDDHVHDANTKGRKSTTHLIMDAWIKGIRRLRVIHYNYIEPGSAAELLEAAEILNIDVRIGIEFSARFRDKYAQIIWVPRGYKDAQGFLLFLAEEPAMDLMAQGRAVSQFQQQYVMELLDRYNDRHRIDLGRTFDVELPAISREEFLDFVRIGQKSTLHLVNIIDQKLQTALQEKVTRLREKVAGASVEERQQIETWVADVNERDLGQEVRRYLTPENNPGLVYPKVPGNDSDRPELLRLTPRELLDRLEGLHSGHRITLNLTNLTAADVLELLYDCEGDISRLEIFNLKDFAQGKTPHIPDISILQGAINSGNPIALKRVIRRIIRQVTLSETADRDDRVEKLTAILHDILSLKAYYQGTPLKARIGSDSTGQTPRIHGMGLALKETLPLRARREIRRGRGASHETIPMKITAYRRMTYVPRHNAGSDTQGLLSRLKWWHYRPRRDWKVQEDSIRMENPGNIVTLGGIQKKIDNGLRLDTTPSPERERRSYWTDLNSKVKNSLKVIIGFIPAFATFALTKEWWLLAYFGAFIWFGITGFRNILQSVLGGGGLRRSPMLRWNDYVSWERIADSLLFTGFSVPLLDYLVKTVFLDRLLGITVSTNPVALYTVMAVANGLYLSSHNAYRGLPRGAILGNFFRSILSIPIAIGFNAAIGGILIAAGASGVDLILQKWAAIISKAASDMVAGIIEGAADRYNNIRIRFREYRKKLSELLDIYSQLEMLFPESGTLEILDSPQQFRKNVNAEARDLERIIMVHALDLLYFWMYQPRARSALRQLLNRITEEERHLLITSQYTLLRQQEISQMFIDGVVGKDFARALSFYLSRYPEYLEEMKQYA